MPHANLAQADLVRLYCEPKHDKFQYKVHPKLLLGVQLIAFAGGTASDLSMNIVTN